jgi:ATP-dependent Clp protease ATP-binding subunit ClpA
MPGGLGVSDLGGLRRALQAAIFGQEEAIEACVAAIQRRFQLPARDSERRPVWTALFAGPSGVGKTELGSLLARHFFGDGGRRLIKVDLSELREEHTINRLIGAPPGYKGHGDGGQLTNALRRCSNGVILLDEVEKAHPTILTTVILPMIGDGVIHDMNDGRALDVTNMIVVMTSNLGTNRIGDHPIGFGSLEIGGGEREQQEVRRAIEEHFPREVLGRVDDIIIFSALSGDVLRRIWQREVAAFESRLAQRGRWRLVVDPVVESEFLTEMAPHVCREGARAIMRFFDKAIVDRCLQLLASANADAGTILVEPSADAAIRYRIETGSSQVRASGESGTVSRGRPA